MSRIVCLFVGTLLLTGCGSGALDRQEAAEVLRGAEFMAEKATATVVVGEHCDGVSSYGSDVNALFALHPPTAKLQNLVSRGFVSLEGKSFSQMDAAIAAGFAMGGMPVDSVFGSGVIPRACRTIAESPRLLYWKATVTPAGVAAGIPQGGGALETHVKVFGEVTGITANQDGTSTAEFTFTWQPTETGKKLGEDGTAAESAAAVFKKYDDGWRLVSVRQLPG